MASFLVFKHQSVNVKIARLLTPFILFLTAFTVQSQQAPDSYKQCVACHGENGQGNSLVNAPMIAGQSAVYLTRQLRHFAAGIRGAHPDDAIAKSMVAIAKPLDFEKDVATLTAYIAALPATTNKSESSGNLMNGSRYYQAKCGACHGGQAQGNEAFNAPKLSGQDVNYLKRQMQHFVAGVRGAHAEDKFGRQMAMMAKTTSGQELTDILHYIAKQK